MDERVTDRGNWMQTYTGLRFHHMDPRPEEICIEDIAHALSMVCRYQGHVRRFYSVAEHSILLSQAMGRDGYPVEQQMQALMHDAAEAYVCDMVRPLKEAIEGYAAIERRIEEVIQGMYGLLAPGQTTGTKSYDTTILYDECKALFRSPAAYWHEQYAPGLGVEIRGWAPEEAEAVFLRQFDLLMDLRGGRIP